MTACVNGRQRVRCYIFLYPKGIGDIIDSAPIGYCITNYGARGDLKNIVRSREGRGCGEFALSITGSFVRVAGTAGLPHSQPLSQGNTERVDRRAIPHSKRDAGPVGRRIRHP